MWNYPYRKLTEYNIICLATSDRADRPLSVYELLLGIVAFAFPSYSSFSLPHLHIREYTHNPLLCILMKSYPLARNTVKRPNTCLGPSCISKNWKTGIFW